ncbi:hypothetical protein B0H16DRAFT_1423274 [Mycena metata]|uniref:F-box domain-containing protein n=1 Tax=Mycena metata TaxID=1033252 RepID=A0AAD7N2N2_9AGAR|nr:hypothetical protein B0H16DRAFT_1423274 [Mycena metata]
MTSPFASRLGTNYCPPDDEVAQIRALLHGPLLRLKDLDDQIANLQKAIDDLARERDGIRSFVDLHKDLISPFRRLPLDIIQEIFVVCLPMHRNCVMSAVEAPVLLGRICSSWRAISLTTPRLWSRLHIVQPSRSWRTGTTVGALEKRLTLRLETTKTWLSRAGQCPLSISFQSSSDTPDVDTSATKTRLFMQAIIPFTPRWKEITLHGVPHEALEMLSNLAEDDVPVLQKLEISQHPDSDTPTHVPFALIRAPNLINLTLATPANIQDLPVRWENLTYLTVWGQDSSALSCSIVAELLARCSRLQVCSFFINARNSDLSPLEDGAGSTIALPFLHSLHISGLPTLDVGNLFRRLSVPVLRDVDLRGPIANNFGKHPFVADFLAFLGVSSCFETLTIDTLLVIPSSFMELLRGLPASTTCLRVADWAFSWSPTNLIGLFDDGMLAVLTPTSENPGSCPALQKLHIIRCTAPSDAALLQFIRARMAVSNRTLETVEIKFSREMQFDITADIQSFLDDGRLKVYQLARFDAGTNRTRCVIGDRMVEIRERGEHVVSSKQTLQHGKTRTSLCREHGTIPEPQGPSQPFCGGKKRPWARIKLAYCKKEEYTQTPLLCEQSREHHNCCAMIIHHNSLPSATSLAMTSPFASRLGTNYCPQDDEVAQIRALLHGPLLRLKDLDDQIANLQKAIDDLARERDGIRSFVDLHKDLISPFRRLPLDIIQEIFVACLPTHRNCVMSAAEAPVLLGRICTSWRAICLTTPRLWSRLHIVQPPQSWSAGTTIDAVLEKKFTLRLETTKTWLSRSGQCPLSISFQSGSYNHPASVDVDTAATKTRLFMQVIIPFTPRWKEITLRGVPHKALEMLSNLAEDDVPMLQKLEISHHPDSDHVPFALMRAPNLINLTLGWTASTQDLPVRWGNLTYLTVWGYNTSSLSCSIVAKLLARCSQLQVCSFVINANNIPLEDGAGSTIELPFLHSFHITNLGLPIRDVGNLFRRLSVPGLRDVDLRAHTDNSLDSHQFVPHFLAFLSVSLCFESLTIDAQQLDPSSLIELLRGLPPSTTCLRVADGVYSWGPANAVGVFNDNMLAVLTPTPENPGSCPALQKLHIIRCTAPSDAALLQFIRARMAVSPRTLETVVIKFSRETQLDIAADIQPFLDDGRLKVITTHTTSPAVEGFSPWEGLPDAPDIVAQTGEHEF